MDVSDSAQAWIITRHICALVSLMGWYSKRAMYDFKGLEVIFHSGNLIIKSMYFILQRGRPFGLQKLKPVFFLDPKQFDADPDLDPSLNLKPHLLC
jgi:hypothetical protein